MVLGADNPVHSSLVFQSQAAVSSLLAALDVLASVQSPKYFPETFSNSGSTARQIDVCAPDFAVLKINCRIGSNNILRNDEKKFCQKSEQILKTVSRKRYLANIPMSRVSPVLTAPGCKLFAVTPVPASFFVNSLANRIFATLLCP